MNIQSCIDGELSALDRRAVIHPFTSFTDHQRVGPWIIKSGRGVRVTDASGREYIDGVSGLACVNVGYGREEIARAMYEQAMTLAYSPTFWSMSHEPVIRLANRLIQLAPGGMERVLFGTSGSDANDTQMKLIWYYNNLLGRPQKKKIVARERGYHGTTIAAGSLTGLPGLHSAFDLPLPQVRHVRAPDYLKYAEPGMSEREFSNVMASELEALILAEGPGTMAAFIAEPVVGSSGGVLVPTEGYWEGMTAVLKRYDMLLIADEVVSGFGRTGAMFACEHFDLEPDLMTLSKGLTSGYVPLSASLVSERVMRVLGEATGGFAHGYTNSGHPVLAAAALANLDIIEGENLVENAATVGAYMQLRLRELFGGHPLVRDVRGIGLIAGIELMEDAEQGTDGLSVRVLRRCYDEGIMVRATAGNPTITLSPPLSITRAEVDMLLDCFRRGFEAAVDAVRQNSV